MPSYCAFLGHQPHISLAELIAIVPGFHLDHQPQPDIVMFSTTEPLARDLFEHLGGTYAIAQGIGKEGSSLSDGPQLLLQCCASIRGKITFGLRAVGIPPNTVKENYRRYKDTLKRAGRPCRYVGNEHRPAAAALLKDSGMLSGKHGVELTLVQLPGSLWIGRTIAAQDVDAYTKRDIGKPARDTTSGLLPPKLAQVMLNLGAWLLHTSKPQTSPRTTPNTQHPTILDPFCGTGVIPIECLMRGWNVLASDMSQRAVSACERNLEWIRKEEQILKKDVASDVWKQDATKAFALKKLPDLIVTETMLGPALSRVPAPGPADRLRRQIEKMEEQFLRNAAATLPGVPLVCCWPFWRLDGGAVVRCTGIWEKLNAIGYRAVLPAVPGLPDKSLSLLYRRNDQFVGREIVLLQPVKRSAVATAAPQKKAPAKTKKPKRRSR